jgi:hypothetical protein
MKKFSLMLLIAFGVGGLSASALGYDYENQERSEYSQVAWPWEGGGLQWQINHLNRMVGHVRWELSRYHGDSRVRREFAQIRREVDHVNWQYRNGHHDQRQLRAEIDRIRFRLHDLEGRMHVRRNDFYNWR